ncbi:MAG: hypothetical protein KGI80_04095 [Verrucomicrobiota bacterium]|nr:hypothetical protein [Verrucomicrobiota bacterium]
MIFSACFNNQRSVSSINHTSIQEYSGRIFTHLKGVAQHIGYGIKEICNRVQSLFFSFLKSINDYFSALSARFDSWRKRWITPVTKQKNDTRGKNQTPESPVTNHDTKTKRPIYDNSSTSHQRKSIAKVIDLDDYRNYEKNEIIDIERCPEYSPHQNDSPPTRKDLLTINDLLSNIDSYISGFTKNRETKSIDISDVIDGETIEVESPPNNNRNSFCPITVDNSETTVSSARTSSNSTPSTWQTVASDNEQ